MTADLQNAEHAVTQKRRQLEHARGQLDLWIHRVAVLERSLRLAEQTVEGLRMDAPSPALPVVPMAHDSGCA